MANSLLLALYMTAFLVLMITAILFIVGRRYQKFTNRDFVMVFRNGKLIRTGYGGGYFLLPLIDEIVVLPMADHLMEFSIRQQIVFKPKFEEDEPNKKIDYVAISGFILYKIHDYERFHSNGCSVFGSSTTGDDLIISSSKIMKDIVEGYLMRQVLEQSLDQLYTIRSKLMSQIYEILDEFRSRNGIVFLEGEITRFQI